MPWSMLRWFCGSFAVQKGPQIGLGRPPLPRGAMLSVSASQRAKPQALGTSRLLSIGTRRKRALAQEI